MAPEPCTPRVQGALIECVLFRQLQNKAGQHWQACNVNISVQPHALMNNVRIDLLFWKFLPMVNLDKCVLCRVLGVFLLSNRHLNALCNVCSSLKRGALTCFLHPGYHHASPQ
jgi:hypothetical protein